MHGILTINRHVGFFHHEILIVNLPEADEIFKIISKKKKDGNGTLFSVFKDAGLLNLHTSTVWGTMTFEKTYFVRYILRIWSLGKPGMGMEQRKENI